MKVKKYSTMTDATLIANTLADKMRSLTSLHCHDHPQDALAVDEAAEILSEISIELNDDDIRNKCAGNKQFLQAMIKGLHDYYLQKISPTTAGGEADFLSLRSSSSSIRDSPTFSICISIMIKICEKSTSLKKFFEISNQKKSCVLQEVHAKIPSASLLEECIRLLWDLVKIESDFATQVRRERTHELNIV